MMMWTISISDFWVGVIATVVVFGFLGILCVTAGRWLPGND